MCPNFATRNKIVLPLAKSVLVQSRGRSRSNASCLVHGPPSNGPATRVCWAWHTVVVLQSGSARILDVHHTDARNNCQCQEHNRDPRCTAYRYMRTYVMCARSNRQERSNPTKLSHGHGDWRSGSRWRRFDIPRRRRWQRVFPESVPISWRASRTTWTGCWKRGWIGGGSSPSSTAKTTMKRLWLHVLIGHMGHAGFACSDTQEPSCGLKNTNPEVQIEHNDDPPSKAKFAPTCEAVC